MLIRLKAIRDNAYARTVLRCAHHSASFSLITPFHRAISQVVDYVIKNSNGSECPKVMLTKVWNVTEEALNELEKNFDGQLDLSFIKDLGDVLPLSIP